MLANEEATFKKNWKEKPDYQGFVALHDFIL
jgi:hypothetical protein